MGKLTVILTDETEKQLHSYLSSKYPKQKLDKLSEVIEISIKEYLEKQKEGVSNQVFY